MIDQAICIVGLENHLLCPMQCHLNGVYIPKFLAESPNEASHALELTDHLDSAYPLITKVVRPVVLMYIP